MKTTAQEVDPQLKLEMVGSYRRGLPDSGDIDILLTSPAFDPEPATLNQLVAKLKEKQVIVEDLSQGPLKYMGIGKWTPESTARRIDISVLPYRSYWTGLLHYTGSQEFNRYMRREAISKGYSLSEYELKKIDTGGIFFILYIMIKLI